MVHAADTRRRITQTDGYAGSKEGLYQQRRSAGDDLANINAPLLRGR
jgi:hypothetical protein